MGGSSEQVRTILEEHASEVMKVTLSDCVDKSFPSRKVNIHPVLIKGAKVWQWSWQEGRQQRHENLSWEDSVGRILPLLGRTYRQGVITASQEWHITARNSDGWKIKDRRIESSDQNGSPGIQDHNRKKSYLIPEGQPCPFLQAVGVMTDQGKVRSNQYHKFRQINRFLEMIDDVSEGLLPQDGRTLQIVDYGSGKSYLTFAMRHYFEQKGIKVELTAIDVRPDVIKTCREIAEQLGFENMTFEVGEIANFRKGVSIDLAVALHACDTATDDALELALLRQAQVILAVPCCQHELRPKLSGDLLAPMFRHGILKEQFASLLTDTLRALALEREGYSVQIMEFIDLEHTHKNLLLRAVKRREPDEDVRQMISLQMEALAQNFGVTGGSCLLNSARSGGST